MARSTSAFDNARHARAFASVLDAFAQIPLLRTGLQLGLFEALRTPLPPAELAERLGLAPDLVAAWARMLHAQGWLQHKGDAYRLGPTLVWLLDAPESAALQSLLDLAVETMAPQLGSLPELLKGGERPAFGGGDGPMRIAAIARLVEPRALRALERVPGARHPHRILDVGCGQGTYLTALLKRFRDAMGLGIELDPRVADDARRRLEEADVSRRAEIRSGDFMSSALPEGRFDLILFNHNFHYFAPGDRVPLMRRARERLESRGVLVVQTMVVSEGLLPSLLGLQAGAALFDLLLRTHSNLHGLPDVETVHEVLREAGFAVTGEVPVVAGGAVRFVWGSDRHTTAD